MICCTLTTISIYYMSEYTHVKLLPYEESYCINKNNQYLENLLASMVMRSSSVEGGLKHKNYTVLTS